MQIHPVKKLRATFFYACSPKAHIEEICQYLCNNPEYDIVGVAETCFHSMIKDSTIIIDGYSLVRQKRETHMGVVWPCISGIAIDLPSLPPRTPLVLADWALSNTL